MFSILDDITIGTEAALREDEVQRLLTERAARRRESSPDSRAWRWRVEPGKEVEFDHLRSWLLSGLPEGPRETAAFPHRQREDLATSRRPSPVRLGARLAGRAAMRAGRLLLQWGDAADETETSAA